MRVFPRCPRGVTAGQNPEGWGTPGRGEGWGGVGTLGGGFSHGASEAQPDMGRRTSPRGHPRFCSTARGIDCSGAMRGPADNPPWGRLGYPLRPQTPSCPAPCPTPCSAGTAPGEQPRTVYWQGAVMYSVTAAPAGP